MQSDTGPAGVVVRHPPPLCAEKKGGAILSVYHGPTGFTGWELEKVETTHKASEIGKEIKHCQIF